LPSTRRTPSFGSRAARAPRVPPPSRTSRGSQEKSSMRLQPKFILQGVRNPEHVGFHEVGREHLSAHWQTVHAPDRNGDAGDSRQVGGRGEDVAQVHVVRIRFRAERERGGRRGGREKRVHATAEYAREVLRDERTNTLRTAI